MDIKQIEVSFSKLLPPELVNQLLETYSEVKRNYYLGNLRPNEVEGGRFAEAVFRILEYETNGMFTVLNKQLDTETLIRRLANKPAGSVPDSIRLHIPRALRMIYDIRNKRDAAHLADGIDPNLQDATLVCSCCDWVMAELVRLYHGFTADKAQKVVQDLVSRKAPVVQEFGETLKTLQPKLQVSERVLVLLYHRGQDGATFEQLSSWLKPSQRLNLRRTLQNLEYEKDFIVLKDKLYHITRLGEQEVEKRKLLSSE